MPALVADTAQKQRVPSVTGMLRPVTEHDDNVPIATIPVNAGANKHDVPGTKVNVDPLLLHTRSPCNVTVVPTSDNACVTTNEPATLTMIPSRAITCCTVRTVMRS